LEPFETFKYQNSQWFLPTSFYACAAIEETNKNSEEMRNYKKYPFLKN